MVAVTWLYAGTHAARPAATGLVPGTLYYETDRTVLYYGDGSVWHYVAGSTLGTLSPDTRPVGLGASDFGYLFLAGDVLVYYFWNGASWAKIDPMFALGDTLYEDATPKPVRLPGNITAIRKFLRQLGTGTVSAAPAWDTLVIGDIPNTTTVGTPGVDTQVPTEKAVRTAITGLDPMTTLGDTMYEDATPAPARLPGNTTAIRKFLRQTGTGTISAVPTWDTIVAADVPNLVTTQNDVTGSRVLNTVYQNTGTRTMWVAVACVLARVLGIQSTAQARTDSSATPTTVVGTVTTSTGLTLDGLQNAPMTFLVLPGNYYTVVTTGTANIGSWIEWQ